MLLIGRICNLEQLRRHPQNVTAGKVTLSKLFRWFGDGSSIAAPAKALARVELRKVDRENRGLKKSGDGE